MQIGYYQGNRVNNQGNHGVLSPLRCSMDSSWSPTPDLYFSDVPMSTSGASDPGCVRAESVCAGLWGSIHGASALAGLQSQSKLPYAWGYNRLPVSCPDDASVAMNGGLGHQSNLPVPSRAHSCDGAVQTLGELPHHAAVSANFLAHDTHGGTLPMASTQPCVSCPLSPASGSLLQASSNEQSAPCDDTYAALLTSDTLLRSLAMYMSSAQN